MLFRSGPTPASRTGASILTAAGLGDLVCRDLDTYVATVLALLDRPVRPRPAGLFDATARARQLERGFAMMAQRHRAGLPPATIEVAGDGA